MLTTDDHDLGERLRRLRVHGDRGGYRHGEIGLNSRLDALQAAILHVKLAHLEKWTEARRANARRYENLFAQYGLLDLVTLPNELPGLRHVYNQFTIRVKRGRRDAVLNVAPQRADRRGDLLSDSASPAGLLPFPRLQARRSAGG